MGYSLGARVVFSCLEELARRHARARARAKRRDRRRAIAAALTGAGAHEGGHVAVAGGESDEDDVDDDEPLKGTLTIVPLDGVHWCKGVDGPVRLAVRAGGGRGYRVGAAVDVRAAPARLLKSYSSRAWPVR